MLAGTVTEHPVPNTAASAIRAVVRGTVQGVGFRDATLARARSLAVTGWVRNGEDGTVLVHAEGSERALAELASFLGGGPAPARVSALEIEPVAVEGHEQFAIRGVSAGRFSVQELGGARHTFALHLEVAGQMRAWRLPRGPSLDPALRRLAVAVAEPVASDADFEGKNAVGGAIVWDRGGYEQGGRVPWPEALSRGHAVFVLNGQKLRGGFALQRTRGGAEEQWLLIKRRDEHARPGSDVTAECPRSVLGGDTLQELLR
jgi:DNA ligase D-like protein (predicted 3'-phosphoesterase)